MLNRFRLKVNKHCIKMRYIDKNALPAASVALAASSTPAPATKSQIQHTGYIQRKSNPNLRRDEVRRKQTDSIPATRLHPKISHPNLHPYALITI